MLPALQVVTTVIVALAMVPAVAHALELPGKKRLSRDAYLTAQPIYYPGFTFVGGSAELLGMLCTLWCPRSRRVELTKKRLGA
jgi:hypothetical protein